MFCTQAKHGVNCLELPLIQHRHLPDLERLSSVLRGMLSGLWFHFGVALDIKNYVGTCYYEYKDMIWFESFSYIALFSCHMYDI